MSRLVAVGFVLLVACGPAVGPSAAELDSGHVIGPADGGRGGASDAGALFHASVSVQTELTSAGSYYQAWAVFDRSQSGAPGCQVAMVAGCASSACQRPTLDGGSGPQGQGSNAGTITITGGAAPVTLEVQPDGGYTAKNVQNVVYFQGSETLVVSAAGNPAGVGAFGASLVAPTVPTMTNWVAAPVVDRRGDLHLTWDTGGTGEVEVTVADATFDHVVSCRFSRLALGATIPGAALQTLPPGGGRLDVVAEAVADLRVGDWEVAFSATRHAANGSGSLALATITLQ
jgi:hypothetical protein